MSTVLLDTHDYDAAAATITTLYPHIRISAAARPGNPSRTRVRRASLGALQVDEIEIDYEAHFRAGSPDEPQLMCVRSGTVEFEGEGGDVVRIGPGQAGAFGGAEGVSITGRIVRPRFHVITTNRRALAVRAAARREPQPTNRQMVRVADYVCTTVSAASSSSPLVADAEELVAATVLAALPKAALDTPVPLRRAIRFIDVHAGSDISLDDIAHAVYVTPRALQYMFRKHRDCTPMEYLRNVRLDSARCELLAGDRTTTSVGEIARRWSIGHLGRFATNYRDRYDESPSETLRG